VKEKYETLKTIIENKEMIETILNLVFENKYLNARKLVGFNFLFDWVISFF